MTALCFNLAKIVWLAKDNDSWRQNRIPISFIYVINPILPHKMELSVPRKHIVKYWFQNTAQQGAG